MATDRERENETTRPPELADDRRVRISRDSGAIVGARYELAGEIGRGAMAVVYLARDLRHGRSVAIKFVDVRVADAVIMARFLREIDALSKLQHPNALPLYDSGEHDGSPYYVMPFVRGESLRARLDREKALPLIDALRVAIDVCGALEAAHVLGFVHRDVKPENILLSNEHALLADFGIAHAMNESLPRRRLTDAGAALGTPAYMSPEQATGEEVDGRSDIFSLGCVLYEMLSGTPPFRGAPNTVVAQRFAAPPQPLREARVGLPEAVIRAVDHALAVDAANRFASAVELRDVLVDAHADAVTARANARSHGWLAAAGNAAAVFLASLRRDTRPPAP
jgi:serine/threonine protein kinase